MMTNTYQVTGMTCGSCEQKVKQALLALPDIVSVEVNRATREAVVRMNKHVPTTAMNQALAVAGNYSIQEATEQHHATPIAPAAEKEVAPVTLKTYKPLILVFAYILAGVAMGQISGGWNWMTAMSAFMGLFFIVFSFFKMLDLQGFAYSYSSYDIVAQKWLGYGYIYPFIELVLGIAYLTGFNPIATNLVTLIVMSVSTIGVVKGILRKSPFKCACLGTVFNLPMSTVTLVEDSLMVLMAAIMLITLTV